MPTNNPDLPVVREDECLFAWTPGPRDGTWTYYPPFINVSRRDGRIVVIVRATEDRTGQHPNAGAWAEITVPDEEIARMAAALSHQEVE